MQAYKTRKAARQAMAARQVIADREEMAQLGEIYANPWEAYKKSCEDRVDDTMRIGVRPVLNQIARHFKLDDDSNMQLEKTLKTILMTKLLRLDGETHNW